MKALWAVDTSRRQLTSLYKSLIFYTDFAKAESASEDDHDYHTIHEGANPADYWERYHGAPLTHFLADPSRLPADHAEYIRHQAPFWEERKSGLVVPTGPRIATPKTVPPGAAAEGPPSPKAAQRMQTLRNAADDYVAGIGLPPIDHDHRPAKVDHVKATEFARMFEKMKDQPHHPLVQKSYDALIKETLAQYEALKRAGIKYEAIRPDMDEPYGTSSENMLHDLHHNGHLWYFTTRGGYGSPGEFEHALKTNPMLREVNERAPKGHKGPVYANDIFRIVHDIMGHGLVGGDTRSGRGWRGYTFGPAGEESAWRHHRLMYTPLARMAMTQELRGQNSWVNYGPFGAKNRIDRPGTTYAAQKNGIWPSEAQGVYGAER